MKSGLCALRILGEISALSHHIEQSIESWKWWNSVGLISRKHSVYYKIAFF